MKTKEKIIQTAIRLFNASDIKSVTTNHIAEQAGISPGNLYYYFRNKEEIISAIFDQMATEELTACTQGEIGDIEMLMDFFEKLLNIYWKYRFFRFELTFLLNQDRSLKKKFIAYQDYQINDTESCLKRFMEEGIIKPISEKQIKAIAHNTALILNFWIPYVKSSSKSFTKQSVREGIEVIIETLNLLKA